MRRAAIGAVASLAGACSILTSFDGIEPRSPIADVAPDVVGDTGPDAACLRTRWPDPPEGSDTAVDVGELTSAVTQLRILEPLAEGKIQGFDLDGLCTCPDRPACIGPKPNEPCDTTDSGIDNAGDGLFQTFAAQGIALDDMGLKTGIQMGQYGVLIRISGYNGEANDPALKVAVFNAVAVNGDGGVPRNDGTDRWTVDSESLLDNRFPAYFSAKAYVAGGVLVADLLRVILRARIPTGPSSFSLLELDLRSAHLVARIGARSATGIVLEDGRIAGRIPAPTLLAQGMRSGACRDSGVYEVLKPIVCAARDLPFDPAQDGRDQSCESLSVGFGFTSAPALIEVGSSTRVDTFPCSIVPDECP